MSEAAARSPGAVREAAPLEGEGEGEGEEEIAPEETSLFPCRENIQAATPERARPITLPLHLTPGEPHNERLSMGSVAACSPSACLRDYLSGAQRRRSQVS